MRRLRIITDIKYAGDPMPLGIKGAFQKAISDVTIKHMGRIERVRRTDTYVGSDESVARYEVRQVNSVHWKVVDLETGETAVEAYDLGTIDAEEIVRTMADHLNSKGV